MRLKADRHNSECFLGPVEPPRCLSLLGDFHPIVFLGSHNVSGLGNDKQSDKHQHERDDAVAGHDFIMVELAHSYLPSGTFII